MCVCQSNLGYTHQCAVLNYAAFMWGLENNPNGWSVHLTFKIEANVACSSTHNVVCRRILLPGRYPMAAAAAWQSEGLQIVTGDSGGG